MSKIILNTQIMHYNEQGVLRIIAHQWRIKAKERNWNTENRETEIQEISQRTKLIVIFVTKKGMTGGAPLHSLAVHQEGFSF